jgi:hypothetical protein
MWLSLNGLKGSKATIYHDFPPAIIRSISCPVLQQCAKERDNLSFFLTYADNNAVTFFAKQGFTTEVTYSRDQVHHIF